MTALTLLLALSFVSGLLLIAIVKYDKWKYGECIESPDGGVMYTKHISRAMSTTQAIRSRSFAPNVTKGATLLSLSHKN